jgi:hypothetical protein
MASDRSSESSARERWSSPSCSKRRKSSPALASDALELRPRVVGLGQRVVAAPRRGEHAREADHRFRASRQEIDRALEGAVGVLVTARGDHAPAERDEILPRPRGSPSAARASARRTACTKLSGSAWTSFS